MTPETEFASAHTTSVVNGSSTQDSLQSADDADGQSTAVRSARSVHGYTIVTGASLPSHNATFLSFIPSDILRRHHSVITHLRPFSTSLRLCRLYSLVTNTPCFSFATYHTHHRIVFFSCVLYLWRLAQLFSWAGFSIYFFVLVVLLITPGLDRRATATVVAVVLIRPDLFA